VRNNYDTGPIDPRPVVTEARGARWTIPSCCAWTTLRKLPVFTQGPSRSSGAGNGPQLSTSRAPSGIQWEYGAVGTQRFTRACGWPTCWALAKLRPTAPATWRSTASDKPPHGRWRPDFIRSVPRWKAEEGHTMLGLGDGRQAHPASARRPRARAIVPGLRGPSASIKWAGAHHGAPPTSSTAST